MEKHDIGSIPHANFSDEVVKEVYTILHLKLLPTEAISAIADYIQTTSTRVLINVILDTSIGRHADESNFNMDHCSWKALLTLVDENEDTAEKLSRERFDLFGYVIAHKY